MSERDELIDCLRYRPVATTAAQMREAADLLERDGVEIARLRAYIQEMVEKAAAKSLDLTKLGALLSCGLAWRAAGDEVDDIADLLGKLCGIHVTLSDGGQGDLLGRAA